MKEIVKVEQGFGGDGATAKAALGVEQSTLKLEVSVNYPIDKLIAPIADTVDKVLDSVERAIPGDWDKGLITQLKIQARADLVKLLSE